MTPKTDAELQDAMRAFVRDVMDWFEKPGNLPLTRGEQAQFIRWAYGVAAELRDSEPFLRGELVKAATVYMDHDPI